MSRLYLSNPCASSYYPLHTVLTGAAGARLSLRPLFTEGQRDCKTQAISRRESENARLSTVIASEAKQSSFLCGDIVCALRAEVAYD
jgi:hypothetical protein